MILSSNVFVSWSSDDAARQVGEMELANDPDAIRALSQRLDAGNTCFRSWCERHSGEVIAMDGQEGRISIAVEWLPELNQIIELYKSTIKGSCSVGVGMKLSDSARALAIAQFRGGDKVILWVSSMEKELNEAIENKNKPKDAPEEVKKAEPTPPEPPKPPETEEKKPDEPKKSIEDEFHSHATAHATNTRHEAQLKAGLLAALQAVKQQLPQIEAIKQQAPDLYATIMGISQELVLVAKDLFKSEEEVTETYPLALEKMALADIPKGKPSHPTTEPMFPDKKHETTDYSHLISPIHRKTFKLRVVTIAPNEHRKEPFLKADLIHGGVSHGSVMATIKDRSKERPSAYNPHPSSEPSVNVLNIGHAQLNPEHRNKGLGAAMYEALMAHAKNNMGVQIVGGTKHSTLAHGVHQRLAQKHGMDYHAEKTKEPILNDKDPGAFDDAYGPYKYALKSEDMAKGLRGDWQSEGYKINHLGDGLFEASLNGVGAGMLEARPSEAEPGKLYPVMVNVPKEHRRKGIGTALYQHAEKHYGLPFKHGSYQSDSAKAMWAQKNRPFGKSEGSDVKEKQLGTFRDATVWEVRGDLIRDNIDIDFTEGGNHARYDWIPEGEIWLEHTESHADMAACALHEYIECHLMNKGMGYDEAHDLASVIEKAFRNKAGDRNFESADDWLDEHWKPNESMVEESDEADSSDEIRLDPAPDETDGDSGTLDKSLKKGLPGKLAPAKLAIKLPVGAIRNGKVKIKHSDNKTSWKSVRAGMVQSQDPSGHPNSSAEPNAKSEPKVEDAK